MSSPTASALDETIHAAGAALEARQVLAPTVLVLSGAGLGLLPGRLRGGTRLPLSALPRVPAVWREALLHAGELEGLAVWLLEDVVPAAEPLQHAWERAWPVWLAGAQGATALLDVRGACSLDDAPLGAIALASDHINLSGSSPLVGLGESRLGPMFPDQSLLHDPHLRRAALTACQRLGLVGLETVFACTAGPALETPAEQRWFHAAGAGVSVQGLAPALLAAAHAGLGVLALGAVVTSAGERVDIARLAATARRLAPALDDLVVELSRAAELQARASLDEELT